MTMFYDGHKPVWKEHQHYPWDEYKHLDRDKFEKLVTMMIDAYPDDPLTEWLKRGFAMNEGDSTISFSSLEGYKKSKLSLMFSNREMGIENFLDIKRNKAFEGLGKTTFERKSGILAKN